MRVQHRPAISVRMTAPSGITTGAFREAEIARHDPHVRHCPFLPLIWRYTHAPAGTASSPWPRPVRDNRFYCQTTTDFAPTRGARRCRLTAPFLRLISRKSANSYWSHWVDLDQCIAGPEQALHSPTTVSIVSSPSMRSRTSRTACSPLGEIEQGVIAWGLLVAVPYVTLANAIWSTRIIEFQRAFVCLFEIGRSRHRQRKQPDPVNRGVAQVPLPAGVRKHAGTQADLCQTAHVQRGPRD